MRIPRVFVDAELRSEQLVTLPKEAARHVGKVLRLPAGAPLVLFNGQGGEWLAELRFEDGIAQAELREYDGANKASPLAVTLLQAIGRGERMDYAIQKAVELGVAAIQPLFTERTVVKLDGQRLQKRQQHWQQVAVAACEQSGRNLVPTVMPACRFAEALAIEADLRCLLAPAADSPLPAQVQPQTVALLIGPEGGLSGAELEQATAAGWQAWQLGPRILRTETAGSAALAILQARWGDFK